VLEYANNATYIKYNKPFAPHHLGVWPVCDLRPEQQEDMPIEETAGIFILLAAIAQRMDISVVLKSYWPLLQSYGDFLVLNLIDPPPQLCTDDFNGLTVHDVNLVSKGIMGLYAFTILLDKVGQSSIAYRHIADQYVSLWELMSNASDHFLKRYDQTGWSLKYNMAWQKVLGLNVFNESLFDLELAYYKTKMLKFGIPLDGTHVYTKADSLSWIAAFAQTPTDFAEIFHPIYLYAHTTGDRWPMGDWYNTDSGTLNWFVARTVLGGFWLQAIAKKA